MGTAAAEGWPGLFCRCDACNKARALGGKNIRTRAGAMIDGRLLIDFSADTYMHLLRDGLDLSACDSVFITHDHEDHFYPADLFMRTNVFAHLMDAPPTLIVYGSDRVGEKLTKGIRAAQTNALRFEKLTAFREAAAPSGHSVLPVRALHDRSQECLCFVVRKDGKAVLYGHDTGIFPQETFDALRGLHLDVATFDCTCGPIPDGKNHMGFCDVLEQRNRLTQIGCLDASSQIVVTHFSHNGGLLHEELRALVEPQGFSVAYDGVVLTA